MARPKRVSDEIAAEEIGEIAYKHPEYGVMNVVVLAHLHNVPVSVHQTRRLLRELRRQQAEAFAK